MPNPNFRSPTKARLSQRKLITNGRNATTPAFRIRTNIWFMQKPGDSSTRRSRQAVPRQPAQVQATHVGYELHSLGWKGFQDLCGSVTAEVLGQTVQMFLPSRDG